MAYCLFSLSSLFKSLGKLVISKNKTIVVDALTLPGWFVLDCFIIHQMPYDDGKLIGFKWDTYPMPDEWIRQMDKLKNTSKMN